MLLRESCGDAASETFELPSPTLLEVLQLDFVEHPASEMPFACVASVRQEVVSVEALRTAILAYEPRPFIPLIVSLRYCPVLVFKGFLASVASEL